VVVDGKSCPARSNSRTRVPDRDRRVLGSPGAVFSVAIPQTAVDQNASSNFNGSIPSSLEEKSSNAR
jgi:hypothetical protein